MFCISGPSGTGKGTIREAFERKHPDLEFCVSVTTRLPRPNEEPGVSYIFVGVDEFHQMAERGEFLETANVYGNYYGTPREPVTRLLEQGVDVLLEKDVQGALAIKQKMPEAVLVFIAPPSFDELRARIMKRGTETDNDVEVRLGWAEAELKQVRHFDYVVVNYEVAESVRVLDAIVVAERHRTKRLREYIR